MPWHRYLWQPFYTLWVIVTFVTGILLLVPVVAIISIPNSARSRKVVYHVLKGTAWLWLNIIGMPTSRLGHLPPNRRYVVVANHIAYIDAVVLFVAAPGYFRPLGKKEMAHIPLFGFIYKQIVLLVDRSSAQSRSRSMRLMWRALRNQCHIFIFPEGTFNETCEPLLPFYDGAFRLSVQTGCEILPVLFLDTVKRNDYRNWWKFSPGRNRLLYLPPIAPEGKDPSCIPLLKQQVSNEMGKALLAEGYPYCSLPPNGKN